MECYQCNNETKEHRNYYNSNGIINNFICKVCDRCTLCHLNENDHLIEFENNNNNKDQVLPTRNNKVHDVFKDNWR